MSYNKSVGDFGEKIATDFLIKQGYRIEAKNYHCRFGEIDIIASKQDFLYFVEVKTRRNMKYGLAEEAVNFSKKAKIAKTIQEYIFTNEISQQYCFQVIAVYLNFETRRASIKQYLSVALF